MRKYGSLALMLGVLGFLYCSDRLSTLPAPPTNVSVAKALEDPSARWQIG